MSLCTCSTENDSKGRFLTVSMISWSLRHQFLLWRLWQEALGTDNHFSWIAAMSAGQSALQASRLLAERFLLPPAGSVAASFTGWLMLVKDTVALPSRNQAPCSFIDASELGDELTSLFPPFSCPLHVQLVCLHVPHPSHPTTFSLVQHLAWKCRWSGTARQGWCVCS